MDIGIRMRSIRTQQGRTLEELARACDCSKSLLSKIENGRIVPALATLSKIAVALGVRVSALMEDGADDQPALTPNLSERPEAFVATDKGYTIYAVAPHFLNKKMQPVLVYRQQTHRRTHQCHRPQPQQTHRRTRRFRRPQPQRTHQPVHRHPR